MHFPRKFICNQEKYIYYFIHFVLKTKKWRNNGLLLNGLLSLKLLNNVYVLWFFTNLDFLLLHTAHFDGNIGPPFLVFNIFESTLSVPFLHFKQ